MVLAVPLVGIPVVQSPAAAASQSASVHTEESKGESAGLDVEDEVGIWQSDFNVATTELAVAFPEDFAEAVINDDSVSGWIGFRSATPEGAMPLLDKLTSVTIQENMGYSAVEVDTSASDLLRQAETFRGGFDQVVVFREGATQTFEIRFGSESGNEAGNEASRGVQVEESLTADEILPPNFGVNVESSNEDLISTEASNGGLSLGGCTTAFPIKRNGGAELGLLTAGHCPGTGTYDGVANAFNSPYPGSLLTTDVGNGGDFRWNWSKYMLSGRTYIGGTTRAFTQAANAATGTSICVYGRNTDDCTKVVAKQDVYYSAWIPDGNAYYRVGPLRGTAEHITEPGDSGGPWYRYQVAYGIHSGAVDGGSVFSTLPNALNRLGVSLWVG
ncbi:S1 family peptidase [Cryobacterium sp. PAMC25264]|uniref:S1 family peptidase n=1 Tax=Cryobacterium sp. PAMC25264 TaxID=2861288 RepID=UPI001C6399B9|nr:S1 family peptidase [Cryobacterium sp. PAMC25264]QYF73986.1 S1 family peptidase [Cryobacterium sp. PAMC25264]